MLISTYIPPSRHKGLEGRAKEDLNSGLWSTGLSLTVATLMACICLGNRPSQMLKSPDLITTPQVTAALQMCVWVHMLSKLELLRYRWPGATEPVLGLGSGWDPDSSRTRRKRSACACVRERGQQERGQHCLSPFSVLSSSSIMCTPMAHHQAELAV